MHRVILLLSVLAGHVGAQSITAASELRTRAEQTAYRETSSYADVMDFVRQVSGLAGDLRLTSFGYSMEGRALPLVVVGDVADASPDAVRASGKTRVFIQANIHAGEVCGKEAMLMMLRDLAQGAHPQWSDSLVLVIAPIYNADGNERVRLVNRPRQHGPVAGMGQRPNAQGLDLNRDHMKMESPEARALVGLMNAYDPHLSIDLHTTNGTRHAYHLTYSPPLHPNTPAAIDDFLRGELLPTVTDDIRSRYGWEYYYYGNLPFGGNRERGWYTFDHRPRFNNNYIGLRNRLAVLSEAYSYATFEDRVIGTLRFVESILDFSHTHAGRIRAIVDEADRTSVVGQELALRAEVARSAAPVDILLGEVVEEPNPFTGETMLRRTDVVHREQMPEFGTFRATESERAPRAYYVPAELTDVIAKLSAHGVEYETLDEATTIAVQAFPIDSSTVAPREFQGHQERTLFGRWEEAERAIPAGTVVVHLDQPLGRLAFTLLEPRSDDGFANWNMLDAAIDGGRDYPILRRP